MKRFRRLCWWLAGLYFIWSLAVYFGAREHQWWPIMVYPLIYPWGVLYNADIEPMLEHLLSPGPQEPPERVWQILDYAMGGYYIVWGSIWMWIVGRVLSSAVTWMWPIRETRDHQLF